MVSAHSGVKGKEEANMHAKECSNAGPKVFCRICKNTYKEFLEKKETEWIILWRNHPEICHFERFLRDFPRRYLDVKKIQLNLLTGFFKRRCRLRSIYRKVLNRNTIAILPEHRSMFPKKFSKYLKFIQ